MTDARPRLWVISDIYHPEDVSTGHVLTRLAEGMATDADVFVVSGMPSYAKVGDRPPRREDRNGTRIQRLGWFAFPKDRLVLRALNVLSFTLVAWWFLWWRMRSGDRILCVTNPPSLAPLLAPMARRRGAHFVLLVHDVFPETAVAAGKLRPDSLLFRLLSAFAARAWKQAAAVVVLGRDMARLAASKRGTAEGVSIIENWADLDEILPRPKADNPILQELGWTQKKVIQFSGNLGRTHGVETILEAAHLMRNDPEWRWLIAGFGGKEELVAEAARNNPVIAALPRQPREKLNDLLCAADVHVIAFVPGMEGLSVPSRMYNIMAAGRPIIAVADANSELALTVLEQGIGWHVPAGDARALAALVADGVRPQSIIQAGFNSRRAAEQHFVFESKLATFRQLLRLAGNAAGPPESTCTAEQVETPGVA